MSFLVVSWLENYKLEMARKPKYNPDLLNHQLWDIIPKVRGIVCQNCRTRRGDIRGDRRIGLAWVICKKCHDLGFKFYFMPWSVTPVLHSPKQSSRLLLQAQR